MYLDHLTSAMILGLSFAGRWYAGKIGVTKTPFTASIACMIIIINMQQYISGTCVLFAINLLKGKEIRVHSRREKKL